MRKTAKLLGVLGIGGVLVMGVMISTASAVVPVVNELVSVDSSGLQGNASTQSHSDISGDGRYVVFETGSTNAVAGDTNGFNDVFIRDRATSSTTRVSVSSLGAEGNGHSTDPQISYSGRYVVFTSHATNLVAGDTNGYADIFIHDRQSGTTTLVSADGGGMLANRSSGQADINADGRFITFTSNASNLVSGINPIGVGQQIFLKDMATGNVKAISLNGSGTIGNASSLTPKLNCSGNVITFYTGATNLVAGDTNGKQDVFVSVVGWSGNQLTDITLTGNGHSQKPSISCDGNTVAYETGATNLAASSGTNGGVIKYDRLAADHTFISVDSSNMPDWGGAPTVSGNGRYIAFWSYGSLQPAYDTNGNYDVYIRDTKAGTTQVVSRNSTYAVGWSDYPSISADGSFVSYGNIESSTSPYGKLLPGDANGGKRDIYVSETGY